MLVRHERGVPHTMIFKPLSKEEYDRLSPEEKMNYLQRLMGDIREKMDESRRAIEERQQRLDNKGS